MIAAITMDGRLARHSKEHVDWTSPEDKKHLRTKMRECDVLVLGNNTFATSQKFLEKYNKVILTRSVAGVKKEDDKLTYINSEKSDIKAYFNDSGYKNVCVLGGSQIYSYFLKAGLLDEIWLTIEPIIFGSGISLFGPPTGSESTQNNNEVDKKIETREYKLVTVKQLNNKGTVLLHYIK